VTDAKRPPTPKTGTSDETRPFLPSKPARSVVVDHDTSAADIGVRAYLITGGRVDVTERTLAYETMLKRTRKGSDMELMFERADIVGLCTEGALSVAEISARLQIPIGVVRVLASDMLGEGFLTAHAGSPDQTKDVTLLTRLINGVRAL
jgi:Protein of unknown function (DUF742)